MTDSWRYFDIARQKRAGNSNNSISSAVVTPGYMISCDKLFDSDVSEDKYKYMESASPCDYMHISIQRPNTRDSGGEERDGADRRTAPPSVAPERWTQTVLRRHHQ